MNKNNKRSVKLYQTLTNKQKAAVFMQLAARQDTAEADRLLSQVKRRTYTGLDTEYLHWCDSFINVCAIIGLEFWRQSFLHAFTLLNAQAEEVPDAATQAKGRTLALQLVLKDLCDQHGFDYGAACEVATLPPGPVDLPEVADVDFYKTWLADLGACLPSGSTGQA